VHHEISFEGQRRWSSTQVLAASDLDKHTSIPWPEAVRDKLEEWLIADRG
jgi:4-hydroxybenzoyl-CoA thioesterase